MKVKVYVVDFELPRWARRALVIGGIPALLVVGATAVVHADVQLPPDLQAHSQLKAADLNTRFNALATAINATDAQLANLHDVTVGTPLSATVGIPGTGGPWLTIVNGPVVSVQPKETGTYRIYGMINAQIYAHSSLGSGGIGVRITVAQNAVNATELLNSSDSVSVPPYTTAVPQGSMEAAGTARPELIVTLQKGQNYSFLVQVQSWAQSNIYGGSALVAERIQ